MVSDSSRPHGLQPTRLLHPWDFPGKSTGVCCHCLLWFMCYSRLILGSLHKVHQVIIRSHLNTRCFNYRSLFRFGGQKKLENFPFWTILYFYFYLFIKLKNIYWEPTVFQYSSFPYSGSDGEETACNAGDLGSVPGLGRSPGEGNGNSPQYSCLENSMDRGAWWATVHAVI